MPPDQGFEGLPLGIGEAPLQLVRFRLFFPGDVNAQCAWGLDGVGLLFFNCAPDVAPLLPLLLPVAPLLPLVPRLVLFPAVLWTPVPILPTGPPLALATLPAGEGPIFLTPVIAKTLMVPLPRRVGDLVVGTRERSGFLQRLRR